MSQTWWQPSSHRSGQLPAAQGGHQRPGAGLGAGGGLRPLVVGDRGEKAGQLLERERAEDLDSLWTTSRPSLLLVAPLAPAVAMAGGFTIRLAAAIVSSPRSTRRTTSGGHS